VDAVSSSGAVLPSVETLRRRFLHHPVVVTDLPPFVHDATQRYIHIPLRPGANPKYIQQYKMSHEEMLALEEEVAKLVATGRVEPSTSSWNSSVLMVKKPGWKPGMPGKYRCCVDFRAVNTQVLPDTYPMPVADLALHYYAPQLRRSQVFSLVDIKSAFFCLPLHPDSRDVTTFQTPSGSWRWCVLPMGILTAPAVFAREIARAAWHGCVCHCIYR
jgi:hypothetical protein